MGRLEHLAQEARIDLFYGDESGAALSPCIPHGWPCKDEEVSTLGTSGKVVNGFALLSRDNLCFFRTTEQGIDATWGCDYLDQFSQGLTRPTVVVLDNAPVHQGRLKI